jgi:uridine kinase
MGRPQVILVDGIDGSGKTQFAARLMAALEAGHPRPALIHVDDFRREVNWADPRGEAEVYWEDYFDLALVDRTIAGLRSDGRLVVVEGIFTLRLAEATEAALIYLEVTYREAARRILERDIRLGRTADDVRHRISARYFPAQQRYRAAFHPLDQAALVLENSEPSAPRVQRADWDRFPPLLARALRSEARPA